MIVVWSPERNRFEAITSFMERHVPKAERWRWDSARRRWWAPTEDLARRLRRHAQGEAALRLLGLDREEKAALAASMAPDSTQEFPAPAGLSYMPFQRAGIAYALDRPGALIADEMGLGKTIQAIGVVNALSAGAVALDGARSELRSMSDTAAPLRRVLIVCPASLRLNWRTEWRRWHTGSLKPVLLDVWPGGLFDDTAGKALICSYDSVRKWHPRIAETLWDMLILDEAHFVKDASTRRAATIFGGKRDGVAYASLSAKRKLFLTGTPIVNKPGELWPLVHALAPDGLGKSKADFNMRYGTNGSTLQLGELHMRLRSQIMVRRRKEDVLKELPKKRRQLVLLEVAGAEKIIEAEALALERQRRALEAARREAAELSHAEQVARLHACRGIALSEIAKVRHETALLKLPAAIEHIHEVLSNVDKCAVYAHHHDVLDALGSEFRRIGVSLDGRTSEEARQAAVDAFQQERRVRLFLGSIRAAGVGLTLTAASVVIFVELDWTPAAMTQAEDRLHRIGQLSPVLAQHLVIDGSIDAKMSALLVAKQEMIDNALDGGNGGNEGGRADILSEVLR